MFYKRGMMTDAYVYKQIVMVTVPVLQSANDQRFSYKKFTLLLIFILSYEIREETESYRKIFYRDLGFCNGCFRQQISNCENFFNSLEYDITSNPWQNIINLLPKNSKRSTEFLKYKKNTQSSRIIAKHITQKNLYSLTTPTTIDHLRRQFLHSERLDGLQFCPSERIDKFVEYLKEHTPLGSDLSAWLHLTLNIEPLLMPYLEGIGYPVPITVAVCGFTLYQAYAGKALIYYYNADFVLKLRIAKQLLEAAIKFSKGFAGFRIYITDLSADNLVFDEFSRKLYFVDLDTVLIVDSSSSSSSSKQLNKNSTQKHLYIECDDCFAYSQQDICSYGLSDINLFSACQFLRENLKRDRESGFLYPIPEDISRAYPKFEQMLDNCVDCADMRCTNRFAATLDLIELFNVILNEFY